ncbi:hypothetical protein NEMIN01_1595 [Nematocida minor]|uniref:uncharacterized protein n=1 Tax=Nematocida minor TaxID=1912983 RepID=UPI0022210AC6|nr:uncharacterized protein NEMIN01_1595 [Nematocida minor]KAI5191611.1 hypothetical protein NEMIN01_1595 [Nematocida minor]
MDLQERAVIVGVQLKSSTYSKDRLSALNEALEIVNDDNLIGGTEFLDPLIFILQNTPGACADEVFKILSRIFTGKNGREFTNIFVNKIGASFIINTVLETEEIKISEEVKDVVFIVIKHNKTLIIEELLRMNKHSALIDESLKGRETLIEMLVELGRDSNTFRKILIFNEFIDGLMKLSCDKSRSIARCSIKSLAELMNSDISVVNYFFEMRWKEWMVYVLKTHPEHGLKVAYAFSEYPKYRTFLSTFSNTLFEIKDIASLFLLSYTETAHTPELAELVKSASTTTCPCKLNFVLGSYANIAATGKVAEKEVGSIEFFGVISNFSVEIDDLEITTFLASFSSLQTMPVNESLLFLKTGIAIALRKESEIIFLPEVLLSLREYLQNDSLLADTRVLISFWLFLGYIYHKDKPSFLDSIFNNFHESVLPLSLRFLTSLTHPAYNLQCQEGECTRCYFLQLTTPDVIPHSIALLTQLLWVPSSLHSLIFSKFSMFFRDPQVPPPPEIKTPPAQTDSEPTPAAEVTPAPNTPPSPTKSPTTGIFDL